MPTRVRLGIGGFLGRGAIIVLVFFLLANQSVSAFSSAQRKVVSEGVYQFNTEAGQCTTDGAAQTTSVVMPANATLDDKVAQTFMVGFDAGTPQATVTKVVTDTHIGGIYLTGTTDAKSGGWSKDYFDSLGKAAGVPLMIASDEEGGQIHRFAYTSEFPSAKTMGSMTDAQVEKFAQQAGQTMSSNGVTVDFAPVLDIDNGKSDGAISANNRAFSSDPATITAKAGAFAKGLQAGGVTPVFKHFPGLGRALPNSNTDAHKATSPSLADLKAADLVPYGKLAGQYGAPVMLSNEYVAGVDGSNPASESADVVNLLRGTYNFNGLIMTDDLKPASTYDGQGSLPNSIAKAEAAGANMPLFSFTSEQDIKTAIALVKTQASAAQVTTSVSKVIAVKGGADASKTAPATASGGAGCCSTGPISPDSSKGTDHVPDMFSFLTSKGLTAVQAAAITGNLQWESGSKKINPTGDQSGGSSPPLTPGIGYGIAQWTDGGRQQRLVDYANSVHGSYKDYTVQRDFFWYEATKFYGGAVAHIKTMNDVNAATEYWMKTYEGPSDPHLAERQAYAREVVGRFNSGNLQAVTASPGGCDQSSAGFAGDAGKYAKVINCPSDTSIKCTKTIYYSQYEGPWAKETFSSCGTVAACGCGLTSAAMAIATLTNNASVTPQTLLPVWQANGLATDGGTGWSVSGWKAVGAKYGVTISQLSAHQSTGMTDAEIQGIVDALMQGALVGVSGQGPNPPFTTGGHFILIRGYDPAKKQFLINDPNNNLSDLKTTSKTWGWDMLRGEGQSAWKFTK